MSAQSPGKPVSTTTALPSLARNNATARHHQMLEKAANSVACLAKCPLEIDLKAAVQELVCFIHNMRASLSQSSSVDQMAHDVWPVRSGFRHTPHGACRLAAGDTNMIIYLANHDIAFLIAGDISPSIGLALSHIERVKRVMQMHEALKSHFTEISGLQCCSSKHKQKDSRSRQCQVFQALLSTLETCSDVSQRV